MEVGDTVRNTKSKYVGKVYAIVWDEPSQCNKIAISNPEGTTPIDFASLETLQANGWEVSGANDLERRQVFCQECGSEMIFQEQVDNQDCYWCECCGADYQEPVFWGVTND